MILMIDGREASTSEASFTQWKFGRLQGDTAPFVLRVPYAGIAVDFGAAYDSAIAELKRDDECTGAFCPPYDGATSYPTLDELFALSSEQRMRMVNTYFKFDLLGLCLEEEAPRARWLVHGIDQVDRIDDDLVISGWLVRRQAG